MAKSSLLAALSCFLLSFSVGCGGGGGDSSVPGESALIGPNGGQLVSEDGQLKIIVPAGALTQEIEISISPDSSHDLHEGVSSHLAVTSIYQISPNNLQFSLPITVSLKVSDHELAAINESGFASSLPFLMSEESKVELLKNQRLSVDASNSEIEISGEIDHFSRIWLSSPLNNNSDFSFSIADVPNNANVIPVSFISSVNIFKSGTYDLSADAIHFQDNTLAPLSFVGKARNQSFVATLSPGTAQSVGAPFEYRCIGDGSAKVFEDVTFEKLSVNSILGQAVPGFDKKTTEYTVSFSKTVTCGTGESAVTFEIAPDESSGCAALSGFAYKNIEGDCGIGVTGVSVTDPNSLTLYPFGLNSDVEFSYFPGSTTAAFSKSRDLLIIDTFSHVCTLSCLEDGTAFRLGCQSDADPNFSCSELFVR